MKQGIFKFWAILDVFALKNLEFSKNIFTGSSFFLLNRFWIVIFIWYNSHRSCMLVDSLRRVSGSFPACSREILPSQLGFHDFRKSRFSRQNRRKITKSENPLFQHPCEGIALLCLSTNLLIATLQKLVESTELAENARKTVLESRIDSVGKKLEPAKSS